MRTLIAECISPVFSLFVFALTQKEPKKSRQKNAAPRTFQSTPAFLPGQRTWASQSRMSKLIDATSSENGGLRFTFTAIRLQNTSSREWNQAMSFPPMAMNQTQ
jgi:hypothetical protein